MTLAQQADKHAVDKLALPDNPGSEVIANTIQ
jgi:hypothetical protein